MNKIKHAIRLEIPHKWSGRFSEIFQYPLAIFEFICKASSMIDFALSKESNE